MAVEIKDFAEQVLFGRALSDKLVDPGALEPGTQALPWTLPVPEPGRPPGLSLATSPGAAWATEDLAAPGARARLLQALANHELLALELMALVLLRFPEAPLAFRQGLAQTLRDEQRHLALYLERLRSLGHELGEEPLSGYFWRALADVRSPLDFVTRMSLTFEQANLDYCLHYMARFREAGDEETARVLEQVYRDEIGHVGHGLRWFQAWKPGGADACDWDSYLQLLPSPLTPNRAKGPSFDAEGRRKAGLSERFVRELRVFSSSKGRPPVVYLFNPGCELELADGRPGYRPPRAVERLAGDLASCLAFLARRDDAVVTPRRPSTPWLEELQELGWDLPEWVVADGPEGVPQALAGRTLGGLRPWGWSPRVSAALGPLGASLKPGAGRDSGASIPTDSERLRRLSSKVWCSELGLGGEGAPEPWLNESLVRSSLDDVEAAVAALFGRGCGVAGVKAPWGASGRGAIRVLGGHWTDEQRGWVRRTLAAQGAVVVEPWLERLVDLSVQLEVDDDRVRELGVTRFVTDERGQFRACVVGPPLRGLDSEQLRALHDGGLLARLRATASAVGERLREAGHRGPAGVDAFLYRWGGQICLRPLVEVNPRLTMGRLALALGERLAPGRTGLWRQLGAAELKPSPLDVAASLRQADPPRVDERGRLRSGVVFTNDPSQASVALGVLQVDAG